MRVYVRVAGAESSPMQTVHTREELQRILDFARIGSQDGQARLVYRVPRKGPHQVIAKYVGGETKSTKLMRARRNPLWGLAAGAALFGLRKLISG